MHQARVQRVALGDVVSDVTGKGVFKWFLLLFGWMMGSSSRKVLDEELQSLKRYCEEQS